MEARPEIDAAVAVIVGNFNPAIFQPAWLAGTGLITSEDQADLELGVLIPAMASFRVGWLTLEVQHTRLSATANDAAHFVLLRDFVVGVLSMLEHTPVSACGINRNMHFKTNSSDEWHAIGHRLIPKTPFAGLIEAPGTRSLTVQGARQGSVARYMQMTIQPSTVVDNGILFGLNEHYDKPEVASASAASDAIHQNWDAALAHFLLAAQTVLERTRSAT